MKKSTKSRPHVMCCVTLNAGASISIVWQFLWEMIMASCLISTIFLWNSSWKMIDNIHTMSSLNVLPSSPPEKIYPELLPDNFRLSRNGAEEIEKYRRVAKMYKKHRPPRTTPLSVWAPSRPFSRLLASPWALLALELLSVPLLGAVEAFCGVGSAVLTNFSKKKKQPERNKTRKNLLTGHYQTQLH